MPKVQNSPEACKCGGGREVVGIMPFLTLFLPSAQPKRPRPSAAKAARVSRAVCAHNASGRGGELARRGAGAAAAVI